MSIAVIENCSVTWRGDFGLADRLQEKTVDSQTRFQFGSMSKPIAAWAVMTLVDQGKIDLDQPINKYLKSWKLQSSEFDVSEVTVRRVLNHTAGLSVPSVSGVDYGAAPPTLVSELSRGQSDNEGPLKIIERPGTKYMYSGGGYTLLQLLIEDVSGVSYAKYVKEKIFKPLKMGTATFSPNKTDLSKTATPYDASGKSNNFRLYGSMAAAGLYATVDDYAKFLVANCENKKSVLGKRSLTSMFQGDTVAPRYGLGFELLPPITGNPIISHSGSNPGWKANFILFPSEGAGILIATNSDAGEPRRKILNIWRDVVVSKFKPASK